MLNIVQFSYYVADDVICSGYQIPGYAGSFVNYYASISPGTVIGIYAIKDSEINWPPDTKPRDTRA